MNASPHDNKADAALYEIAGRRFESGSPGFVEALAQAHATRQRPRCLCQPDGVEMYVARRVGLSASYIVKRLPDTGSLHAPHCPSYEPPAEYSGLGQLLGRAINEDPATGEVRLKLDFSLSKLTGLAHASQNSATSDSVSSEGARLTLRGLLHYLWEQADLTRWHPSFAGKRSWAVVRRHLLQAAENKIVGTHALQSRLYVPESFSVDQREALNTRRQSQWANAMALPGQSKPLMLLIAELKEIVPARYGYKAVIKHMPDQTLALDEAMYRRLVRRFENELKLWAASDALHLVMIATFHVSPAGTPDIEALSLMTVTAEWIPVQDGYEQQLVMTLVAERRSFVKALRYNLPAKAQIAFAMLTDVSAAPLLMAIESPMGCASSITEADWVWRVEMQAAVPELPRK
ncbi:DUF1173 domain-containing protein [Roseateles sp.]|uniref:DUF1173 domain-containing protein n=1 Tax=Roseateles sp. TaxID=1971397 RepID=UPI0037C8934B